MTVAGAADLLLAGVATLALGLGCHGGRHTPPRFSLRPLAGRPGGLGRQDGAGRDARLSFPGAVAWDGAAYLYVADSLNDALRRVSLATGETETVAGGGEPGTADGLAARSRLNRPSALAWAGHGTLYVADQGSGAIRKYDATSGRLETVVRDGFRSPSGLCFFGGRLFVADEGAAAVWSLDPNGRTRRLIAGRPGSPGDSDGPPAQARLRAPEGLATDNAGRLVVADPGSHSIRTVDLATGVVGTLLRGLGMPRGLAVDEPGRLYFSDALAETVRWVDERSGDTGPLVGFSGVPGGADGVGESARLSGPSGLAWLGPGTLAITDEATVRSIDLSQREVRTIAGRPMRAGSADGPGVSATFRVPRGLAVEGGALYVADSGNSTVRRVDRSTGEVRTLVGRAGAPGNVDGAASLARLDRPLSVATAGSTLYIADPWGHRVRSVALASGTVTTLAGGALGSADGTGAAAGFCGPAALAFDGAETLYVADHPYLEESEENEAGDEDQLRPGCGTIRKIDLATGTVVTLAGSATEEGEVDGRGDAARFAAPMALASDGRRLYVADEDGSTIRRIDLQTLRVTTLTGVAGARGERDGIRGEARLDGPDGLALDGRGALLVADGSGGALRRIDLATGAVATLLGRRGGAGPSLSFPAGVLVLDGAVYLTDATENVVWVAAPYGQSPNPSAPIEPTSAKARQEGLSR